MSESYGGAKPKGKGGTGTSEEASKKEDSNESLCLWDVVREETIKNVNTIRVKSVFEDEGEDEIDGSDGVLLKEYKSKRELMKDYESERWGSSVQVGRKGVGLRHRSSV